MRNLHRPATSRQMEQPYSVSQTNFTGMTYGLPITKVKRDSGYSYRNINLIDYITHKSVRPGTRLYSGYNFGTDAINGFLDHRKLGQCFFLRGSTIQRSEKNIGGVTDVFYVSTQSALNASVSTIVEYENEAILANSGALVRIIYDEAWSVYYAYQINIPVPTVIITDVLETPVLPYVYRYIYGFARIIKDGNNLDVVNRIASDANIVLETGTCKTDDVEKDFGEVAFGTAIDNVAADPHVIGTLTCPATNREATHFSLYRTKDIGDNGIDPVSGVGNNDNYYVWVEDVPVAAAYSIQSIVGGTRTLTTRAISKNFVPGDVGSTLGDTIVNVGVIEEYVDEHTVILEAGYSITAGIPRIAIGNGRVFGAYQAGYTITRVTGASYTDDFLASDVGRPIFWEDGGISIISAYVSTTELTALNYAAHNGGAPGIACSATMADATTGFTRKWNDTTLDSGGGEARISLDDRINATSGNKDIYVPSRFYTPLPSGNIVTAGNGFVVTATRDDSKYYYSQIGAKRYIAGQHRADTHWDEVSAPIRHMIRKESTVHVWTMNTTENIVLNISNEVGNEKVGESVVKLTKPYLSDPNIGCYHWPTIKEISSGRFCLLSQEPRVAIFNGERYEMADYGMAPTGDKAVIDYMDQIVSDDNVIASYSPRGGYKLYIIKWVQA